MLLASLATLFIRSSRMCRLWGTCRIGVCSKLHFQYRCVELFQAETVAAGARCARVKTQKQASYPCAEDPKRGDTTGNCKCNNDYGRNSAGTERNYRRPEMAGGGTGDAVGDTDGLRQPVSDCDTEQLGDAIDAADADTDAV